MSVLVKGNQGVSMKKLKHGIFAMAVYFFCNAILYGSASLEKNSSQKNVQIEVEINSLLIPAFSTGNTFVTTIKDAPTLDQEIKAFIKRYGPNKEIAKMYLVKNCEEYEFESIDQIKEACEKISPRPFLKVFLKD
jgi:hypothetical protein